MSTTNAKHTPEGRIAGLETALHVTEQHLAHMRECGDALAEWCCSLDGTRTFDAVRCWNECRNEAPSTDYIARLERTLAAVTAQRDQCREAVERIAAMDGRAMPDHMLPEAIRICRAALRACDEKHSEASIAGENGGAE